MSNHVFVLLPRAGFLLVAWCFTSACRHDGIAPPTATQEASKAVSAPAAAASPEDRAVELAWKKAMSQRAGGDAAKALAFVEYLNENTASLPERSIAKDPLIGWKDLAQNLEFRKNALELFELAQRDRSVTLFARPIVGGIGVDDAQELADCVAVGSSTDWCCSGTLVARNVVVTAKHCLPDCAERVFFGLDIQGIGEIARVSATVKHPTADLAVLVLETDSGHTPRSMQAKESTFVPTRVRVAGFGATNLAGTSGYGEKRFVDIPIKTWACGAPGEAAKYGCRPSTEFVAAPSVPSDPKDSCKGDSGGPAYAQIDNQWVLCGAVSRATDNSTRTCGDGGIYVKIQSYVDWIRSVEGGHW